MSAQQPAPATTRATIAAFEIGPRHYESRLNDCGKANCKRCGGTGKRHPSHGPYWYMCVMSRGSWRRVYLGKELDTTKYVNGNGTVDWDAVRKKRRSKTFVEQTDRECPGQTTIFPQTGPPLGDVADTGGAP